MNGHEVANVGRRTKSRVEFVHVRLGLGDWLGWPQASPRESQRCPIRILAIVEPRSAFVRSFEERHWVRGWVHSKWGNDGNT